MRRSVAPSVLALVVATPAFAADGGTPDAARPVGYGAEFLPKERRDCEAGDLGQCLWGVTRPQSETDRLQLLEKACRLGEYGCVNLAFGLAGGPWHVPVDVVRARALVEPLCEKELENPKDTAAACVILAQIISDLARVPQLLKRACDHGYAGYRRAIYSNFWLPGQPKFHANCGDTEHLGKPVRQRRRRR